MPAPNRDLAMDKNEGAKAQPKKERQTGAATVRIDSREVRLTAISRTKLLLEGVEGDFVAGQRLHFAIIVPVNGEQVEVPTTGIIKSINQGRMVVLYFRPQPRHERYLRMAAKNLPIQPE